MGILRADRVSGLGGANAIVGSTRFAGSGGNGSGKTVTYFKDPSLAPGTSDFCAEAWVYFNWVDGTNNTQIFANLGGNFGFANDTSWAVIRIGASNQFFGWSGSGWVSFGAGAPTVNTWHYIQLVRSSNVFTLYLDGTALGSTVSNSNDLTNDEVYLGGRDDGSEVLDGYISNFRLTIGSSASALAGIVPSAASRVLSTDTKLLCCNDPGNVNNEDAQGIPTSTTPDNDVQMIQGFASRFVPDKGEDYGTTFADGARFNTLSYMVPPGGTTTQSNRGRGVFAGGYYEPGAGSANKNTIDYFNIQSTGNAIDFGDRTTVGHGLATLSSSTRGVMLGGRAYHYPSAPSVPQTNIIDYVTIATTANAQDFGDMVDGDSYIFAAGSNATRGIISKGGTTDMSYVTIATLGNSVDTGGDSTIARNTFTGFASPTRAIFAGGGSPSAINTINYVTITSLGDAINFGDLTFTGHCQGASSETRGIIFTGGFPSAASNVINFITMASAGDATDFGDLPANITSHSAGSGVSNSIRAVRCAGYVAPGATNRIDYVTIATTGNASDFGDVTVARYSGSGFSDSHGGIS